MYGQVHVRRRGGDVQICRRNAHPPVAQFETTHHYRQMKERTATRNRIFLHGEVSRSKDILRCRPEICHTFPRRNCMANATLLTWHSYADKYLLIPQRQIIMRTATGPMRFAPCCRMHDRRTYEEIIFVHASRSFFLCQSRRMCALTSGGCQIVQKFGEKGGPSHFQISCRYRRLCYILKLSLKKISHKPH